MVAGEAVYAVSADGQVRAFKVDNGRSLWKAAALRASVRAPITVDAKHIYAVASPGTVFAVARSTGQIAWRKKVLTSREFLVESRAGALVMGDRVVVGDATGRLSALAGRDGATVWTKTLGADGGGFKDSAHTPVALGADALLFGEGHRSKEVISVPEPGFAGDGYSGQPTTA